MVDALTFSKALVQKAADKGITVSHLKLQKLMYYCQGYSLAINKRAAFDSPIHAWNYGPVVAEIYGRYSIFGNGTIEVPQDQDYASKLAQEMIAVMDYVLNALGGLSPWTLVRKTHSESPWLEHYSKESNHVDQGEITHEQLQNFFVNDESALQDSELVMIMDHVNDNVVEIPTNITNEDEFFEWIQRQ